MLWLSLGLISFFLSLAATFCSKKLAEKWQIVDDPSLSPQRKNQKKPVPLLGASGFILTCSFLMSLLWLFNKFNWFEFSSYLNQNLFFPFRLYWIVIAILLLLVSGFLDDINKLKPKMHVLITFLVLLIVVFLGGLKIEVLSAPFNNWNLNIGILPQLLAVFWLGLCLVATKFLDGMDGLVSSTGIIGFLTIAAVATFPQVNQPLILLFAIIWGAGIMGFLPFNFPDAKLYLGNAGSEVIGLMIGILSILSGAKIATASTVIGWFILDISLVMLARFLTKTPLLQGDSKLHWHHRLLNLGLNKIQVLALTTLILLITVQMGLFFSTEYKMWVILGQIIVISSGFVITLGLSGKGKD